MQKSNGASSAQSRSGLNNYPSAPSFSSLMDDFFNTSLDRFFDPGGSRSGQGRMNVPVNIRETDRSYELELVAPGLNKGDFKIDLSGNMLTVSFDHKEENNEENKNDGWIRREYSRQSFTRSFNLDDSIDPDKIDANYSDGMLKLSLPKKEGAQSSKRSIQIR
jgi:HSP20 family protein